MSGKPAAAMTSAYHLHNKKTYPLYRNIHVQTEFLEFYESLLHILGPPQT